ncbi:cobyrinic acid a,c-diamide synthase [Porphyromonas crevioricanis]|nr:cobyrinate a,c-diamide synthase [Porphyromonas crevioricanis]KGN90715.1 cobyrinic acid a,c-diamide synthase [Porphyromonas crevioricanis]GAD06600.1 cobyrinic acid A,C-diamide synthase [Porphyromonas crevioricanis JCM 13913]
MMRAFLIGATASGSGKTTFTLGVLRALERRGQIVAPFKCGPDYIDSQFHNKAVGRNCSVNLDPFFETPAELRRTFSHYSSSADVSVIEGVMGLYDGYRAAWGSSAEVATSLNVPVVLLVNAKSSAYSVAPVLYGFRHFVSPELEKAPRIAGVVFNRVASESHYQYLLSACQTVGLQALGYLPKMEEVAVPDRHLGLDTTAIDSYDAQIERIADAVEAHVDLEALLNLSTVSLPTEKSDWPDFSATSSLRIGVAQDEAFNFVYRANLDQLSRLGKLTFFSPMRDSALPDADLLYFPGGYPEFYLHELSSNRQMLAAVRSYAEKGGRILAECGGMMYLSDSVRGMDGLTYPMVGLFKQEATMEGMKLQLGYRQFEYAGRKWRGHEFHYSRVLSPLPSLVQMQTARGGDVATALWRRDNVIASYVHLYWGNRSDILSLFD